MARISITYYCRNCGHTVSDNQSYPKNIPPNTPLQALAAKWRCPECKMMRAIATENGVSFTEQGQWRGPMPKPPFPKRQRTATVLPWFERDDKPVTVGGLSPTQRLKIICPNCSHAVEHDSWQLARRFGMKVELTKLAERSRCRRCHTRPCLAEIRQLTYAEQQALSGPTGTPPMPNYRMPDFGGITVTHTTNGRAKAKKRAKAGGPLWKRGINPAWETY